MSARILVAPDKFKGSLTAEAAAAAMVRGVAAARPGAPVCAKPVADGGEGTAAAMGAAMGGRWIEIAGVADPLGRPVRARYAWLPGDVAVLDTAEASGWARLAAQERNPWRASTFGTGQLVADALRRGARRVIVGLGGSATNDGGIGMAAALGWRFLDAEGRGLEPVASSLERVASVVRPTGPEGAAIVGLCDVSNPLTGERGASRTYGPQKGGDAAMAARLDRGLARLADVVAGASGRDRRDMAGAGAAGGLGFGLVSFCGAELRPGFAAVAEAIGLEREIEASAVVLTGEGRLDAQTLDGKGPAGVAALARAHGKPVIAFAGAVAGDVPWAAVFDRVRAITPRVMAPDEAMARAAQLLAEAVEDEMRAWR
jgi:glycerate kinase